ncbi:MAG: ribulose-phosphate 3-epimerase [Terrimicrobiaceae bacterium]|nr:ribulose-phosphate 3-epimerase [Terrimicrobiaceae bacterium]
MTSSSPSRCPEISPSLMCANQGNLRQDVIELDRAGVDSFHFDIMDGNFVPNFAMSPDMMKAVRGATRKPFDAHLMMLHPERYIARFADCGADSITVHAEAAEDLGAILRQIRELNRKSGVAINPGTPVSALEPFIHDVDLVCVMSVEPGFAGQKFIESVLPKIDQLASLISETGASAGIQVDGNISLERIPDLVRRGASMFVGGTSAIFLSDANLTEAVRRVRALFASLTLPNCR